MCIVYVYYHKALRQLATAITVARCSFSVGTSTSSPAVASSEQAAVGSDDDSSMTVQEPGTAGDAH